jgi:hypothetical protein
VSSIVVDGLIGVNSMEIFVFKKHGTYINSKHVNMNGSCGLFEIDC